jgi:hypothetical protein
VSRSRVGAGFPALTRELLASGTLKSEKSCLSLADSPISANFSVENAHFTAFPGGSHASWHQFVKAHDTTHQVASSDSDPYMSRHQKHDPGKDQHSEKSQQQWKQDRQPFWEGSPPFIILHIAQIIQLTRFPDRDAEHEIHTTAEQTLPETNPQEVLQKMHKNAAVTNETWLRHAFCSLT